MSVSQNNFVRPKSLTVGRFNTGCNENNMNYGNINAN